MPNSRRKFPSLKWVNNMPTENIHSTGRRKTAVARVWLKPGSGEITINHRSMADYLGNGPLGSIVKKPLELVGLEEKYNVEINVAGGGISGQAGAMAHGISKALLQINSDLRSTLRQAGLLTRDSRVKERKKYGQRGARARFQFSKR